MARRLPVRRLRGARAPQTRSSGRLGERDLDRPQRAVAVVDHRAARGGGVAEGAARYAYADQLAVGDRLRRDQQALATLEVDLPAAEPAAHLGGVTAEDDGAAPVGRGAGEGLEVVLGRDVLEQFAV